MVGLGHRAEALPRELSAGQQQRVVIARALINRPTLLLADEPSSDLDEETEDEIMEIFSRVHAEQGLTIVMVTHARNLIPFGTRHLEMADGTVARRRLAASTATDAGSASSGRRLSPSEPSLGTPMPFRLGQSQA